MNAANTSFMILSSILVLFMTPGLAFFYGGLVSKRNVVNTMLSVFIMTGVAIVLWIVIGYSLSFSGDIGGVHQLLHNELPGKALRTDPVGPRRRTAVGIRQR